MLVTTERVVALRCPSCGKLGIHKFSLFSANGACVTVNCECGYHKLEISRKGRAMCVQTRCIICEEDHVSLVPLEEVLASDLLTLCCPYTRVDLVHWGTSESEVIQASQRLDPLSEMIGSVEESYFADREIMSEALRILERFADTGQLTCGCGNERINMDVYSDKIELACPACGSLLLVYAEHSSDIEPLRRLDGITLQQGAFECIDAVNYSGRSGTKHKPNE